jgi:hypothetical protein
MLAVAGELGLVLGERGLESRLRVPQGTRKLGRLEETWAERGIRYHLTA